jgi:hypothetical protein
LRKKTSTSEYLAFLSAKYEVDPDRLFYALILAAETRKSVCGDLSIEWRGETRDKIMFLILTKSRVAAQLSILKEFLLEKGHPIRDFMETDKIRRFLAKKARQSSVFAIRDLRSGMTQVCLKAKVLEIPKPNRVYTRYGNYASVANALIADETGTIRLCLWNEQIASIGKNSSLSSLDESTCQAKALISA